MKTIIARMGIVTVLIFVGASAAGAADKDSKYSGEKLKSDVKSVGKGIKGAAVEVGHQIGGGTKKAYRSAKAKISKDTKDGRPGDGSVAKKNEAAPTATKGHR